MESFLKGLQCFCPQGPPPTVAPRVFPAPRAPTAPALWPHVCPCPWPANLPAIHCLPLSPADRVCAFTWRTFQTLFRRPSLRSQNARLEMPSLEPSLPPHQVLNTCSEFVGMSVAKRLHDHMERFFFLPTSPWADPSSPPQALLSCL